MASVPGFVDELLRRFDRFQKDTPAIGFPLAVVKRYGEDRGTRLASSIAYYAFFSVFPALLALVAITGFVLDDHPDFRDSVVESAVGQFPVIGEGIADRSFSGNGLAVALGLVGALWAGTGALLATDEALNQVWDVPRHHRPNFLVSRVRATLMLGVFAVSLVGGTVLANIAAHASLAGFGTWAVRAANLAVTILVAWVAFQVLTRHMIGWRTLLPGAAIAGLGHFVLQNVGSLIVDRYVNGASDTYGTFAIVIGLLVWFNILAQVTILAAEIDVVRCRRLHPRTVWGDDLTEVDRRAFLGYQRAASRHEDFGPDASALTAG